MCILFITSQPISTFHLFISSKYSKLVCTGKLFTELLAFLFICLLTEHLRAWSPNCRCSHISKTTHMQEQKYKDATK